MSLAGPRSRAPLLALLLAVAALPATTASGASALREGDVVAYRVELHDPALVLEVTLTTGPPAPCQDGFARAARCQEITLVARVPPSTATVTRRILFSLDHAEPIETGSWSLGNGSHLNTFARASPQWEGSPSFFRPNAAAQSINAVKLALLAGLSVPARESALGGPTFFGGSAGFARVAPSSVLLRFDAAANATAEPALDVRVVRDAPGAQASTIEVTRRADGARIANATRFVLSPGSGAPLDVDGWRPLDFPTRSRGVALQPWSHAPPSAGDATYLPFWQAELLTTPLSAEFRARNPSGYVPRAAYTEDVAPLDGALSAVPFRLGSWSIHDATPDLATRRVFVDRTGPDVAQAAHADAVIPDPLGSGLITYVPDRASLPSTAISVEDALAIGADRIPINPDSFSVQWSVAQMPGVAHTADAIWYFVSCGVPQGDLPVKIAQISAVNGQLVARVTDGAAACV